ncbi:hypothetical protein EIN_430650 [Entamoeba invadens IP1]|uniref:Uncharacterized protein n=1 Tax=Entamoeba invadens IP1 TaxID=370355 RepID=A0A0A1UGX9_ENTIV|nr:hypothetical protein EIN_430650 [Entamoeba invadens IP1]ELP95259.1 hypothetical protein EIN_430650 [Entamoeba invadens IP1]|eukprot:XP_004262030.1 hypothetical protein EIN_430650 [Entamoeba invadens IP1]
MSKEVLEVVKLFFLTNEKLQPVLEGLHETIFKTKSIEELFIVAYPVLSRYFVNPDVPFEERFGLLDSIVRLITPNNITHLVSLVQANHALSNPESPVEPSVYLGIKQIIEHINAIKGLIESDCEKKEMMPQSVISQIFTVMLDYTAKLNEECVVPISDLLEPINKPAEVIDKTIRLNQLKSKFLMLLSHASTEQLKRVVDHLDKKNCEDGFDFSVDVDQFDLDKLVYFCGLLQ